MSKHRLAKDPLLYIDQPHVRTPIARMQSNYRTPRRETSDSSPITKNDAQKKKTVQRRYGAKPVGDSNQQVDPETLFKHDDNVNEAEAKSERLKFKDMTIREKVSYFADQPTHISKIKCEIKTTTKSYRGIVTDFDGETVWLRTGRSARALTIAFEEIKQVRMLGL